MAQDTTTDPEALFGVLREFLVRCGNPASRTELSTRLAEEEMTLERLRLICITIESRGKPEAETAAHIGQILKSKEAWTEFVEDAEYAAASRAARGGGSREGGRGRRNQGPVNLPDPSVEQQRVRDDLRTYVRERVRDDGQTPEILAAHTGKPLEAILGMLEPGE